MARRRRVVQGSPRLLDSRPWTRFRLRSPPTSTRPATSTREVRRRRSSAPAPATRTGSTSGAWSLSTPASIWVGSSYAVKWSDSIPVRMSGPVMIGLTWGATVTGVWLALPKCEPHWVGESPREGTSAPTGPSPSPWPCSPASARPSSTPSPSAAAVGCRTARKGCRRTGRRSSARCTSSRRASRASAARCSPIYFLPPRGRRPAISASCASARTPARQRLRRVRRLLLEGGSSPRAGGRWRSEARRGASFTARAVPVHAG